MGIVRISLRASLELLEIRNSQQNTNLVCVRPQGGQVETQLTLLGCDRCDEQLETFCTKFCSRPAKVELEGSATSDLLEAKSFKLDMIKGL